MDRWIGGELFVPPDNNHSIIIILLLVCGDFIDPAIMLLVDHVVESSLDLCVADSKQKAQPTTAADTSVFVRRIVVVVPFEHHWLDG